MQQNILRNTSVTKIYLIYLDKNNIKKKEAVKLRFMDNKECYFAAPMGANFEKPKKKTQAELVVYTEDGIYKASVLLKDANLSLRDIVYTVTLPLKWDFIQCRSSSRKMVELPLSIKFNDGYIIEAVSYELSTGGGSFFSKQNIPSIYIRFSGTLTLELPHDLIINFPEGKLITEAKFVREKSEIENHYGEVLYIYKFISLNDDAQMILKNYLMKLT